MVKYFEASELDLRTYHTLYLAFAFIPVFLVPLLPFLLNGAPFIGDSWEHLQLARDVTATGRYRLSSYNDRWPLVNLLIAFIMLVGGLSDFQAGQVVPLLTGLAALSIYLLCRRLGLSRGASIVSVLFLTFNPLYSYVTFTGAVMKETATYCLITLMLLIATIALKHRISKAWITLSTLVGFGIALGHHFAGFVISLFLWGLMGYMLLDKLGGSRLGFSKILVVAVVFSAIFSSWNLLNYRAIGPFFPVFNVTDLALLIASFILIYVSLYQDNGIFSSRMPWLILTAYAIAVLGLRGGIYILAQPTEPLSIWEFRDHLVAAGFSLTGLAIGLRKRCLKAYASAAVGMLLFAFLWGHTYSGFILLVKSLHYFGPLLAVGAGFATAALSRKDNVGRLFAVAAIIFIIYASSTGTILTLNGLGAYSKGELEAAQSLPPISPQIQVYGDIRVSCLFSYASNLTVSRLKTLEDLNPGTLIILLKPNWELGFLYGYDWVVKEAIVSDEQLSTRMRVYDSAYLQAWF